MTDSNENARSESAILLGQRAFPRSPRDYHVQVDVARKARFRAMTHLDMATCAAYDLAVDWPPLGLTHVTAAMATSPTGTMRHHWWCALVGLAARMDDAAVDLSPRPLSICTRSEVGHG